MSNAQPEPAVATSSTDDGRPEPGPDSGVLPVAALTTDLPEFATVMRGYDRGQVEDYVVRLQEFLHDAEVRATNADRRVAQTQRRMEDLERELSRAAEQSASPVAAYDGLGERISTILRLAAEEAESIRTTARAEADALADQTRRECEQARLAAEHDLTDIARRRDGVVTELNRVRDVLTALGLSGGQPTAVQPSQVQTALAEPEQEDGDQGATVVDLTDRHVVGQS